MRQHLPVCESFKLFARKQNKLFLNFNSCKDMKKNNYVQQLWADNPMPAVWKNFPLTMKLLLCFLLFCWFTMCQRQLCPTHYNQCGSKNQTVKVLSQIESQSEFSFL